ncbi:MAG TPA: heparinase II/III family protein, partial [Verrucomicrobiota bacterium]|nr:heparinase II/III family protein [Verrucomicrobiota bacterium]
MTTTTIPIKPALRQAAERLAAVYPPPPIYPSSTEIDTRTRETLKVADAAVDGVLMSCFDSTNRKHLGRSGIDWANLGPLSVLCRMQFIGQLAAAYHVLHDERYAEAARDYMADWMAFWTSDQNKGKIEADGSLSLCCRNAVWASSLHLLIDSGAFDDIFVARVVDFVDEQFEWLRRHLSTTINWRIFEA